ncbi:BlaI/MecI/CopY family transcriptional regulator [Taibaiella chishuiensis]|uniref:Putative transcriptional regulator n=1 Tax=Taibaiella chishuiensis TaxID=1434707 RepID=A0A2P8DA24_9BACT|nr:BlaI/MecI/CopY family transcriptional regulator [Taibaiella chishuiensis]PSK94063.1 putative transcriptional regulator [Taibaiella chishuiensis]
MEKLSAAEEEVMLAAWQTKGGFIRDFMAHMDTDVPYTTIASTVKNLEKKGYLSSSKQANSYYYVPAIAQEDYNRTNLSDVVRHYFANSYKDMVAFFAKDKKISPEELQEIIKLIEKQP